MEGRIWYSLGESDEGEVKYCTVIAFNPIVILNLNNEIPVCLNKLKGWVQICEGMR